MSTLSSFLPKPKHVNLAPDIDDDEEDDASFDLPSFSFLRQSLPTQNMQTSQQLSLPISLKSGFTVKPYGQRQDWVPKLQDDFGDGGAFPEIHVAQFPLNLGKEKMVRPNHMITLQTDTSGKLNFDLIARQGHSADRVVFSRYQDLVPKNISEDETFERPPEEEIKAHLQLARSTLEKITNCKIIAAQPGKINTEPTSGPTYIRYKAANQNSGAGSVVQNRIIKIVEAAHDPLEPPRFKHKRLPQRPPSPPAPVMHSPTRKPSGEELKAWVIPPCTSNWKNSKGFTIALDKRLAADGRGLQQVVVNDRFAQFSDSLGVAEQMAREEVERRNALQRNLDYKKQQEKEEELREKARRAREERAGLVERMHDDVAAAEHEVATGEDVEDDSLDVDHIPLQEPPEKLSEEERKALQERETLRRERDTQRLRELRLSRMGTDTKNKYLSRLENRDISEKIALGLAQPTKLTGESMFDSRLFNRSDNVASNLGDEDSYNLYDKPLFAGTSASMIYKPRVIDGEEAGPSGPVEFEKIDDDVFGLDELLNDAKNAGPRKRSADTLESSSTAEAEPSSKRSR